MTEDSRLLFPTEGEEDAHSVRSSSIRWHSAKGGTRAADGIGYAEGDDPESTAAGQGSASPNP